MKTLETLGLSEYPPLFAKNDSSESLNKLLAAATGT